MKVSKILCAGAVAAAVCFTGASAGAATLVGVFGGNDPFPDPLILDDPEINTPALYKCDDVDEQDPSCVDEYAPGYTDGVFDVTFDSATSGSWTWTPADGVTEPVGPHYIVLKAGQPQNDGGWAVYELDPTEVFGGLWDTGDLDDKAISHISWYNTGIPPIPLPAAAWLLIAGLGTLVAVRRKKRA
ncbi:MAG: VPLPA-CTERM sorting domain-containing protein [Rhodobacteraceae bacterium]|nr:VPLPA-CTERM sorting domain-containing protein [Paracoccaceae bacterium]